MAEFVGHHAEFCVHKTPLQEMWVSLADGGDDTATRDRLAPAAWDDSDTVSAVRAILAASPPGGLSVAELLERLRSEPSFHRHLRASQTVLHHFLLRQREVFWVAKDPLHTTRVGLQRH